MKSSIFDEIRTIKSGSDELKKFGVTIGCALAILGLIILFRGKVYFWYFFFAGAALISFGFLVPRALKPVQKIWMTLAILLGWLTTRLILVIAFFLILTSIALFARLVGKTFLELTFDKSAKSYWIRREKHGPSGGGYEKQF
jgi:hypothetical protein